MKVRAAVRVGGRAHDELVVEDERRHMLHDVAHDFGAEDRHCLAGKLLIGLRGASTRRSEVMVGMVLKCLSRMR